MRRHFSAEVLARYQAGDLGARRAARVAAHLLGCSQCGAFLSDLTAVTRMLAGIERPPMPVAVVERLQLVIVRESASRAAGLAPAADGISSATAADALAADQAGTASGDTAPPAHVPGRPDLPERRSHRRSALPRLSWPRLSSQLVLRGAAAAAAVVVLAGGGFLLARGTNVHGSGSSAGVGRPTSNGGSEHRAAASGAAVNGRAGLHYRSHGKVVPTIALASHENFTRAGLAGQVRHEVASHPRFGEPATQYGTINGGKTAGALGGVSIARLNGCVNLVAAGREVVLTEVARFEGMPATIIVVKAMKAAVLDVAVVRVACSAKAADYIVRTTIPAP